MHVPTHALVLRADPETLGILQDVIDELDRPPPTIEVEVIVLQVTTDAALDLGFDAFIPVTKPKSPQDLIAGVLLDPTGGGFLQPGAGTGPAYAARFTRAPLVFPIVDSDGNPLAPLEVPLGTAVLTANDGRVNSTTLMRPHLRMLAGEEQEIFAGNNIPIPVSSTSATATPSQPFVTAEEHRAPGRRRQPAREADRRGSRGRAPRARSRSDVAGALARGRRRGGRPDHPPAQADLDDPPARTASSWWSASPARRASPAPRRGCPG